MKETGPSTASSISGREVGELNKLDLWLDKNIGELGRLKACVIGDGSAILTALKSIDPAMLSDKVFSKWISSSPWML